MSGPPGRWMKKMNDGYVSQEDLRVLKGLAKDMERAVNAVHNATMQKQAAELLHENTLLKIYLKYGLSSKDGFDEETGKIILGEKKYEDESTEAESDEGVSRCNHG